MKLTQKQETFAQNLFKGMTQREAWIQAGYSSKYALAFIDSNACNLANSIKIKTRLRELNKATEDATVASVLERKQILSEIARGGLHNPIAAISELNKMDGAYAPEKHIGKIIFEVVHVDKQRYLSDGNGFEDDTDTDT